MPVAEFTPNDLAVIEYTSGTSGKPKGVKLTNEAFNALSYFQKQSLKNEVGDKFLLIMPPFIAYGLCRGSGSQQRHPSAAQRSSGRIP